MKKLLAILVLSLMLVSSPVNSGQMGSGELTLSQGAVNAWMEYIKGGLNQKNPDVFLISTDGKNSFYYYCNYPQCAPGNNFLDIQACERRFKGKECKIFARRRTIKWRNSINKGNKKSRFNSKMSEAEVKAKLTELGFLEGTTNTKTKEEKKKETENIFPTNVPGLIIGSKYVITGSFTFKKKTMGDLVYLNDKKRNEKLKEHWNKKYPNHGAELLEAFKKYKAWAESPNKAWAWKSSSISEEDAVRKAVDRCNKHEADRNTPPLCVVTKVGDKHLTYQEQADWMQKIYERTTLAAKLISKNKVEKKKKEKKTDNSNISKQLKTLNNLYKSGALTKEEFEKAKKKLLN